MSRRINSHQCTNILIKSSSHLPPPWENSILLTFSFFLIVYSEINVCGEPVTHFLSDGSEQTFDPRAPELVDVHSKTKYFEFYPWGRKSSTSQKGDINKIGNESKIIVCKTHLLASGKRFTDNNIHRHGIFSPPFFLVLSSQHIR